MSHDYGDLKEPRNISSNNCLQETESAMSELDCPGEKLPQGNGKSFKGVENFLKRVAFNLGNTPSRTEVKIISCIPIDVSDLQQKIIYLEKQLEEARLCDEPKNTCKQKRVVNTVIFDNEYPHVSHTGVSCNALDMDRGTNPYDGNMSAKRKSNVSFAIPSDHGSNINASSSHRYGMPYTDDKRYADFMGYENDMKPFTIGDVKQRQGRKNLFKKKKKALRQKKNRNHYVYYAQTTSNPFNKSDAADVASRNNRARTKSYLAKLIDKQYKPQIFGGNLSDISTFSSPICRDTIDYNVGYSYESDICSCCHGKYHNVDNHQPLVYNSQQIYRAHNLKGEGEFYDSTFYDVVPVKEKPMRAKKTNDIPKRRETKPSVDIMCWPEDVRTKLRTCPVYNPLYLDYTAVVPRIDNYLRRAPKMNNREPERTTVNNIARQRNNMGKQINMEMSKSSCIDFGDVYPKFVKKRIDRVDRCLHVDKCLTATQVPHKVDAECLAIITNNSECQTVSSVLDTKDSIQSSDDKTEETLNQIKTILQSVLREVKVSSMSKSTTNENPKKDATVQKGVSQGNMPGPVQINMAAPLQDSRPIQANLSSLIHGSMPRCQDTLPGIPHNNIGDTLTSNLQGNLQGSRLLNSFTYSPYDINPYLPSCSKQINPNQYYYSQSPLKCYQNFPLIVQNQGRPTCASCFRNSPHIKSYYGRQAATIATNTDTVKAEHSKETEKLIKEIYRSMALSMGAVKKENSSEYEPLRDFSNHVEKSTINRRVAEKPIPVKEFKKVTNVVQAVSELFRKRDMQVSSDSHNLTDSKYGSHREPPESRYGSHNTNTVTESKQISTDATTFSQSPTTNTDMDIKLRKERVEKFLDQTKRRLSEGTHQDKRKFYTATQNTKPDVELSETSSSETETDDTFVPTPTKQVIQKERKEKKGLFSKMFRSVKFLKPKERKKREKKESKAETPTTEESSTDSDDYQTVYSQKIEVPQKHRPKVHNLSKRRTHSKISYRHIYQRDKSPEKFIRRSPYMEQEYRRHWNEKLMFHDSKYPKHPSEHPYSQRYPGEVIRKVNPYYQAYEARAAIIEPKVMAKNDGVYAKSVVPPKQLKNQSNKIEPKMTSKTVPWLKKHKLGNIRCGEHFRQLINEN